MFQLAATPEVSAASAPPPSSVGIGGGSVSDSGAAVRDGHLTPVGFSALYQRHHRALWCIAAAVVKDRELAYDVVQEAAVIALGKLNDFDPTTSFPAWCGQIVRFAALNQRKRNVRSRVRAADPTVLAATATAEAGSGPVAAGAFSGRLAEAIESLDETARACLLMRIVMDMSYKQIAEALAIPEGTAMSHVHRSRQALRRQLEDAYADSAGEGGAA